MAAGDRETTLILKASDLSSQTIEKVLATAAKLLTFQDTLNAKVASGTVKISEFNGSLNNIMQVFTALAQMKLVFPETERLERVVATQKARVEALRAAAAEIEAIPEGERTRKQQSRLDRFTSTELTPAGNPKGTIAKEDARLEQQTARLQRNLDLERAMGVTQENRAALQAEINAGLERHTQELLRAKNAQLEIVEANYREREAQQAIAKAAAEVEAINRRALVDTKAQEAALRELTSEANAFDKAMRSALEAAAKAADRAKGDQFKLDFGDAEFENKKRDEAARKAKADQEQAAADSYRLMRAEADEENRIRNERAAEKKASDERAAADAYKLVRDEADFENRTRDEAVKKSQSTKQQAADDAYRLMRDEAEFENRKRDEIAKKAKADQEQAAADAYRLMRAQADEQNQIFDERAKERKDKQERAAADAYRLMREEADFENQRRDRAQGDKFNIDYGDAVAIDRQIEQAKAKKEKADEEAAANAYRLMRMQADDENKLFDLVASKKRATQEDAAKFAYLLMREQADAENKLHDKQRADAIAYAMQSAELEDKERTAALRKSGQTTQQQADELTKYLEDARRKAADFRAGLPAIQPFGEPVPGAGGFSKTTETVAAIDAIRDPAAAARQTFEGLQAEIGKINAAFETSPKRIQDASKATGDLVAAFNDLRRQAAVFDLFRQAEAETVRTTQAMQEAAQKLNALERQQASATAVDENLTRAIKAQRAEVASSISAYNAANAALAKYKDGAKAAGLQTLDTNAQLKAFSETATQVSERLDALDKITGKSTKSQPILFGLRGYELQNLGYQINDVVTGFASGQQALQILAQQGGQIFQIWERDIGTALYSLRQMPVALGAIGVSLVAVGLAFATFIRATEEASTRRVFAAQLSLDVDGARLSVERLVESVKSIERLGISFSDAAKGARALAGAGITGPQLEQYLKLAANLSNASGGTLSFAEAIKRVSEAFTGGYQELLKFIEADNSLDANTTKQIKDLAELGKIVEARGVAYTALSHKAEEAANKERGAWSASFRDIKNDWHDLLDLLGDSAVLKAAFGPVTSWLSDWVTSFHELLTVAQLLVSILPGLPGQKDKAAGPGAAGSTPFSQTDAASLMALKATLEKKLADLQASDTGGDRMLQQSAQLRATDVKTPGYGGEGFAGLRDTAADLLGITRNFAKSLQESEGVWIGSERRWQNAHETNPESHATGPMQLQPGTFDALKKQFPELIKGTIDDVWSNLVAGLLYAKQKAVEAGGSPARTTEAYHMGSASTPPDRFATAQGQQVAAGSTEVFATNNIAQTKAALEAVNKALAGTKEASQAAATTGVLDPATLERSKRATKDFVEEMHKDALKMRDPFVMGPEAQDREKQLLEEFRKDQIKKAQDYAKQHNAIQLDMVQVNAAIDAQAALKQKEFDDERLKRQIGVSRELNSLNAELAKGDATNIDAQKKTINDRFATLRESMKQQFSGPGAAQTVGGKTFDEVIADINRLEQGEVEQAAAKGWEARVEAVWKKFDEQMKQADTLLQIPGRMADGIKKMQDAVKEFGPGVRSAGEAALTALTKLPDSPAVRAAMERIRTRVAQVDAPGQVRQFTDTAIRTTEQPTTDLIAQRSAEVAAVTARVKAGVITFQDGLREVTDRLAKWLPEMTRAVNQENAALRAINALPTTSETQRAANDKKIADNILALAKAPAAITEFINAGLEDSQKELESLVKRYKDLIAKAVQLQVRGLTAAAQEALAEAEKVRAQIGPARDKLVGNARLAAKTPGLPAGEAASLEERADKAQKEGDPQQLLIQSKLDQAKGAEEQIKQFQSSLREHQATEQALLAKGLITQTAYEAEMKRAYEETAAQAAPAIENLLKLADAAEKAGASASKVAQLRDQAKLLRAELAYVPPLQQQIIQGFEQSFASRGEQAFDAVAKSIGTAIATGGKFKDVLRATGNAFANMAAGILEDVAKIIIKYELLKLVKDALGDSSDLGTGTGNTSSSGTGSATSSAGGVVGLLAKLFGSSSGGAGAAGAFDGAGVAAGTATVGADAGFASEGFMLLAHTGRIVGDPTGMSRPIDLSVFHQAQRMHTGGMVGLAHDEVPMILQKNEEVLSKSDPRNRMNLKAAAGSGGDNGTSIRNVLAVGDKEIASAMNSSHGERVILNVLQRNAPTVKKYVG